jgi:hypothetical protein
MYNKDVFKERVQRTQNEMKAASRGKLTPLVENKIIDELSKIYLTMADKFDQAAQGGSNFPIMDRLAEHPTEQRAYYAMKDLIERMELDFTQKFVLNVKHDIEKDIEISKIQISFLDSVRRHLNGARIQ